AVRGSRGSLGLGGRARAREPVAQLRERPHALPGLAREGPVQPLGADAQRAGAPLDEGRVAGDDREGLLELGRGAAPVEREHHALTAVRLALADDERVAAGARARVDL